MRIGVTIPSPASQAVGRPSIDRPRPNPIHRAALAMSAAPTDPTGHSLILDGEAAAVGDRIDVVPVRAVLHRPAAAR